MKIYCVIGPADITVDQFKRFYSFPLRYSNAEDPTCLYYTGCNNNFDKLVQLELREIGVCPSRIILFHLKNAEMVNLYHSPVREYETEYSRLLALCYESDQDIIMDDSSRGADSFYRRCYERRRKKYLENLTII